MLRAAGWLYGHVIDIRNALYDRGIFRSHSLGARTISVGNITTGGTGKTPLVAYVAELLADAGEKVCILTRGFGRDSAGRILVSDGERVLVDEREGGDEPVELAQKLIGKAIVVADADRVAAAKWAREKFGITSFVLDDGFQHRRARRDLDILCIDATDPLGNSQMLPGGRLREAVINIKRADVVAVTRTEMAPGTEMIRWIVEEANPRAEMFRFKTRIVGEPADRPALAFCGLGNPNNFFELLRASDFDVRATKSFPDHHRYTQSDVTRIETEAGSNGAQILLTTAKDFVKLKRITFEMPVRVIEIRMEIDDEKGFRDLVIPS
ncbi:MAG TPA: tetraacyldisaccharide 4'-kinase [Pyrinomonadaceae bacterium]|nr:tetraacyldisaccharide 4'-kinase [Pyrinomonadaceae bacterium]